MDMNVRKMKNPPPSPDNTYNQPTYGTIMVLETITILHWSEFD